MDDQIAVLAPQPTARTAPELTIVVPTFNERDNIRPLLELIARTLGGDSSEVAGSRYVEGGPPVMGERGGKC